TVYADRLAAAAAEPEKRSNISLLKVQKSAQWLADHYEEVPLYLFCFVAGMGGDGSIYPAAWSAQLAARAEGVGSALTSVLGAFFPAEVASILEVPDPNWRNACTVSFGYPTGRWDVAERMPVDKVAARNSWQGPLGFTVRAPLWPGGVDGEIDGGA
ncbi:MAG TPA: nitroreductase family protein, partial [Acidimicrobiales bacterium]|nr:nitroreductase family protein [Acidimicrobiales bacterium]